MIVICEECGKKYRIDPAQIKGEEARFRCKACAHIIKVAKPKAEAPEPAPPPPPPEAVGITEVEEEPPAPEMKAADTGKAAEEESPRRKGLGLRVKMILLFFVIPMIIVAASGALYLWEFGVFTNQHISLSRDLMTDMAEDVIVDKANAVAQACRLYLQRNPDLKPEDYNYDIGFKKIAVQPVGLTGYTAFYELPDAEGVWRTWAHANPKIIGIDMSKLRKPLGRNFPGFWKIYTGVEGGKESKGYYTWQDADGQMRDKFMACTPVEGTPYVVAATTYVDEFIRPVKRLETLAEQQRKRTAYTLMAILAATILIIGVIVSVYGHKLTGRIKTLTDTTERISVGDLDAEIEIDSKDEIGELSDAISRMQDSIRLSIERLRRRR